MFHGHHRVARLPKEDAGVVAVVDDRVAHDFQALIPLAPNGIALFIARRANLYDAVAGHRVRVHLLRRDVHPADIVAMAGADEAGVIVVHPVRISLAQALPLVASSLRKTFQVNKFSV